jgi:hypothetical protein
MKVTRYGALATLSILILICAAVPVRAQEKQDPSVEAKKVTPLKITVVISEMDGSKKISSLPYFFYVNADDSGGQTTSQVRFSVRVPVISGTSANGQPHIEYMDFNTNVDCKAYSTSDGRFKLNLSMDKTMMGPAILGSTVDDKKSTPAAGDGASNGSSNPVMQHFTSAYNLIIRDGQTIDATSTTDPFSGRVLLVSVTANVVK